MDLLSFLKEKNINISDTSYRRYTGYYNSNSEEDKAFQEKVNKIYNLIENEQARDIEYIAKESNCNLAECILKINYLKNKRIIGDYYIDKIDKRLTPCNAYEQELLKKYSIFIYGNHYQINDIVLTIPECNSKNIDKMREKVYGEIKYLYDKGLLNGIVLNKVDQTIHYYTIDKKNDNLGLITIKCPNCGANNDINRFGKVRCPYCNTIIEDSIPEYIKEIERNN